MRADIVAGAVFPDYELTDHTGERHKLSELQGPDPMILVLSRGSEVWTWSSLESLLVQN
jgi:peroxiredoxin